MILEASHVRRALDTGQFAPYFQPLVVLRTGKTAGFEVLARWNHPDFGMITPSTFIPLAERDGWIDELISEIVRQAFRSAAAIPAPMTLSVNISLFNWVIRISPCRFSAPPRKPAFPWIG